MARDLFHNIVRSALEKDGWIITDDPLSIRCGGVDNKGKIVEWLT